MQEPVVIRKVAVLGAGVMGAQIAAHCVNAGMETLLFDLASAQGQKNAIIAKAIANLGKLKPAPLALPQTASLLQVKNYEDNLADLRDCSLIIEAIAERMDWKEDLYKRIVPFLNEQAILVTNTSGLSINALAEVLPAKLRQRFCGVHFFNPPRYMHLAELIPGRATAPALADFLETLLTSRLGKGVVRAKDTPNFIANRIGVFSLLITMHYAKQMNIGLDEVDALTGSLIGRPKSATFRTMDVVGLDTMTHVVKTMQDQLSDDPWHALFQLPDWLAGLVSQGKLGQKSGQGIYRKRGKDIEVFDLDSGDYRLSQARISPEVTAIMRMAHPNERMQALLASDEPQAQFLTACYLALFHYCAYHLEGIADNVRDVDLAMCWGFGWQHGPFETWQLSGVTTVAEAIQKNPLHERWSSLVKLPSWLQHGRDFYTKDGAWSPERKQYQAVSGLPVYQKQVFYDGSPLEKKHALKPVFENKGVSLSHWQDDIALVSFNSKANTISQDILDGLQQALDTAESQFQGLIIYQQNADNFSSGADLRGIAALIKAKQMDKLEAMLRQFQDLNMRLKYSSIPVVTALRGRALGGGCELMMHSHAIVAAFESWPGLVELGVGLIPAGGGSKEMALRAAERANDADLMPYIQACFQNIATATVASCAPDAIQRGFLRTQDTWVMHRNEVLFAALAKIKSLLAANFCPHRPQRFQVAGREGKAQLQVALVNWLEGHFISQHDYYLANQLAHVLCGGDVNRGEWVDEAWLLHLERQSFMELAATPSSQARIFHLLETGKPLRN